MCLDLTFIWVLLEKGFGLGPETPLYVSFFKIFLFAEDKRVHLFAVVQKN